MKLWTAVLAVEGQPTEDGRVVDKLWWPERTLPIVAGIGSEPVAGIEVVRREAPYIVGDVRFYDTDSGRRFDALVDEAVTGRGPAVPIGVDINPTAYISDGDGLWILDADLLGATLVERSAWPQARFVCERAA